MAEHKGPAAMGLGATGCLPRDRDPNLHLTSGFLLRHGCCVMLNERIKITCFGEEKTASSKWTPVSLGDSH
jgi:hypothetical protein